MLVHIFRGTGRVFGCTENATGSNLPTKYGPWTAFKTIGLERDGEPTAGVNTAECLDDIEIFGFHVTDAHVRITGTCGLTLGVSNATTFGMVKFCRSIELLEILQPFEMKEAAH